jgi:hypothetical protein
LRDKRYSLGLLKEMTWLSGTESSFARAEETMVRIGHLKISDSTIWRRKEEWGARFLAVEEEQRHKANTPCSAHAFRAHALGSEKRMGMSIDGTKVHIRAEGWKELKVACCFDIEVYPTRNKDTGEWENLAHATHNEYVAHLGGPEVFGQKAWALAKRRGWEWAKDHQVIGDGAPWIWNLTQDYYYDAQQTLDYYHGTEHLAHVAALLHGEETPAYKRWYKAAHKALYQGHAELIAQKVVQEAAERSPEVAAGLLKEADYLETHKRRMQYQELRENDYVIGSGMVESAGKQFKARFCGPGMRWNRTGLERLIPIRAAVMGGSFDTMWHTVRNSPPT